MSEDTIRIFALSLYGSTCYMTLREMKDTLEVMLDTEDDSEYTITTKVMTVKEFSELPEFEGY